MDILWNLNKLTCERLFIKIKSENLMMAQEKPHVHEA